MAFRIGALLVLLCPLRSSAKAFLGHDPLDWELPNASGYGQALLEVESKLQPIFVTLPRNQEGRLGSSGVRYLLYRYFLHERAWLMKGLVPGGDSWSGSFPLEIVQLPERSRLRLGGLLEGQGLSLREAASLTVLLEQQVIAEASERLDLVWQAHGFKLEAQISVADLESVLDMHCTTYLLLDMWASMKAGTPLFTVESSRKEILATYPTWPRTQTFLRETMWSKLETAATFNYGEAWSVVEEVIKHFGRWQDTECDELRHKLLSLETSQPGRVDLVDFYGEAPASDQWQFSESIPFLRRLGALDESDPKRPSVLIPNYVMSAANHIGDSDYFELACIDDCMGLLGYIEHRTGVPEVTVQELLAAVQQLPSPSQPAVADIPESLAQKLEDIAVLHEGRVPLHSRLFALWMHNMFPRDCPYPHVAWSTQQMLPEVFQASTGESASLNDESKAEIIASLEAMSQDQTSTTVLPWDMDEEVLSSVLGQSVEESLGKWRALAAVAVAALVVVSFSAGVLMSRRRLKDATGPLLSVGSADSAASGEVMAHQMTPGVAES